VAKVFQLAVNNSVRRFKEQAGRVWARSTAVAKAVLRRVLDGRAAAVRGRDALVRDALVRDELVRDALVRAETSRSIVGPLSHSE
jgi:hypothetical protein